MTKKGFTAIIYFFCMLLAAPLHAEKMEFIGQDCSSRDCFPIIKEIGPYKVPLLGSQLFTYYLWSAYSIALYGPEDARSIEKILSDVPKKLVLIYKLDFSAEEITGAADKLLKKNPKVKFEAISPKLDEINKLYVSVRAGDSYALEYQPGKGTTLLLNGKPLGTVPGAEFARDYFGIWLSEYPISDDMRDQLLRGRVVVN